MGNIDIQCKGDLGNMSYTVCNIDKVKLDSMMNQNVKIPPYQSHQYDLAYMFQRYSLNPDSFVDWFIKQMNLTGQEVGLELGCLSESYWIHNLDYAYLFQKLYLVDESVDNILQSKRILKNFSNTDIRLSHSEGLNIDDQSVDLAYSSNINMNPDCSNSRSLLSEVVRVLKNDGTFYYTYISEDYYASIYRLVEEYDSSLMMIDMLSQCIRTNYQEIEQLLSIAFLNIERCEFQARWMVDSVDDLIGFILCDSKLKKLKSIVFKNGISKFRLFLQAKIERLGGISITRKVIVISCKQKRLCS